MVNYDNLAKILKTTFCESANYRALTFTSGPIYIHY
jgi:hypothetical protein